MKYRFVFALLLAGMSLIACSGDKASTKEFFVETVDGVEIIHNTATPAFPGKTLRFEEEFSFGGEDLEGKVLVYKPGRIAVGPDGTLYIFDRDDYSIKVFTPEKHLINSFGGKGQGPGEFQAVNDLICLPGGRILVTDRLARKATLFSSSGEYLNAYQWQNSIGQLMYATDSYLVTSVSRNEQTSTGWQSIELINKYDYAGSIIKAYGEFRGERFISKTMAGNRTYSTVEIESPRTICAGDQMRRLLYSCSSDRYVINVRNESGDIIRRIERPYQALPFTRIDIEEYRASYEDYKNEEMKKMLSSMSMPDKKNVIADLFVDDRGYLWVLTNEKKKEEKQYLYAVDVFDCDGRYDAKVWIDRTLVNNISKVFSSGNLYRIEIDQDSGYRFIKKYHMIWSE